jgi:hypothetical protein
MKIIVREFYRISNTIYINVLLKKELDIYYSDILDILDNIRVELNERY